MWSKITLEVWEVKIRKLKLPIFFNVDFLKTTSKNFNVEVYCYSFEKRGRLLALGAFYVKSKKIITPESFSFTALWFANELSDVAYLECADSLIQLLKDNFYKISLRLSSQINDVRPFIWSNFRIENKYTYIKRDYSEPHYSISKNLSKLPENHYCFKVENIDPQSIEVNLKFLKVLGFSNALCDFYKPLIIEWGKLGFVKAFNVYKQNELICSNIVIIDISENKIYTILLNNVSDQEKYAHTYLYQSIINWAKENYITEIDLCGANLPSVAKFKSYFNAELVGYFVVTNSTFINRIYNFKMFFKLHLKRMIKVLDKIKGLKIEK